MTQHSQMVKMRGFRMRCLLTYVALATACVDGQVDIFNNLKTSIMSSGSSSFTNLLSSTQNSMVGKLFSSLPSTMQSQITSGNFSNSTPSDLIGIIPKNFWNSINPVNLFTSLGKSKVLQLVQSGSSALPARVQDALNQFIDSNLTKAEAIQQFVNGNAQTSRTRSFATIAQLGDPANWTSSDVTQMQSFLFKLPSTVLKRIQDAGAQNTVLNLLAACNVIQPDNYCPQPPGSNMLHTMMLNRIYGPPQFWNLSTLGSVNLNTLPTDVITQLKPEVVLANKANVTMYDGTVNRAVVARILVLKLKTAEMVPNMTTAAAVTAWVNSLGQMKKYVFIGDVPPATLTDTTLKAQLMDNNNIMVSSVNSNKKEIMRLSKELMKNKDPRTLTQSDVTQYGNALLNGPPSVLKSMINLNLLTSDTLTKFGAQLQGMSGPGSDSKANIVASKLIASSATLPLSFPGNLLGNVPPNLLKTISAGSLPALMSQSATNVYSPAQKAIINSKLMPENLASIQYSAGFKASVSTLQLSTLSLQSISMFAQDIPGSPSAMMALSKAFDAKTNLTAADLSANLRLIPLITPKEAVKINVSEIMDALRVISKGLNLVPLSRDTCIALKNKMVEFAMMTWGAMGEEDTLSSLTTGDVENTPPGVMAAFGSNAIANLRPDQSVMLLFNMGTGIHHPSIPVMTRRMIVSKGLQAMCPPSPPMGIPMALCPSPLVGQPPRGVMPPPPMGAPGPNSLPAQSVAELPDLGVSSLDLDPSILLTLPIERARYIVSLANYLQAQPNTLCLDQDTRDAIGFLMEKVKGPTSTWETAEDVCCILGMLNDAQMKSIPLEVLSTCDCPDLSDGHRDFALTTAIYCEADLGDDVYSLITNRDSVVLTLQQNAALQYQANPATTQMRRKKRGASTWPSVCDQAAVGGADIVDITSLQTTAPADVMSCLYDLGSTFISDSNKTLFLAGQVLQAANGSLRNLALADLKNLGWILQGFNASNMGTLPPLTNPAYTDVLDQLGQVLTLDPSVLVVLANNTKTNYQQPAAMTGTDLQVINQIVCGFTIADVNAITTTSFSQAVVTLNNLKNCSMNITQALATKAKQAYGAPSTWTNAVVAEMGLLVAGLAPEDIQTIPATAFSGMGPYAFASLPDNSIKALQASQLMALSSDTAMSISPDQINLMTPDMQTALNGAILQQQPSNPSAQRSGALGVLAGTWSVCLVALTLILALD